MNRTDRFGIQDYSKRVSYRPPANWYRRLSNPLGVVLTALGLDPVFRISAAESPQAGHHETVRGIEACRSAVSVVPTADLHAGRMKDMKNMTRRRWNDLPRWQRTTTAVLAPVELALTVAAAVDLSRRPARQIRGSKAVWWPAIFVQPVGPALYLWWGRHGGH